jgi:hypothetical protein
MKVRYSSHGGSEMRYSDKPLPFDSTSNHYTMTSHHKMNSQKKRPLRIWFILLVAILLAFFIWLHFDIQIEKLKMGG